MGLMESLNPSEMAQRQLNRKGLGISSNLALPFVVILTKGLGASLFVPDIPDMAKGWFKRPPVGWFVLAPRYTATTTDKP